LKPFFYVTRLYFIRTDLDDLWLWQFTDLKDFAMAESGDAGCLLKFEFADWTHRVVVAANEALRFEAELKRWHRENEDALRRNDLDYVITHDDFLALREQGPIQSTAYRATRRIWLSVEFVLGLLAGLTIVWGIDQLIRLKPSPPSSRDVVEKVPISPASVPLPIGWSFADEPSPASGLPPIAAPGAQATGKEPITDIPETVPCQASVGGKGQYRPENGTEFDSERTDEGHSKLTVTNGNPEDAAVTVSNVVPKSDDRLMYVRAGMTAIMGGFAPGQYRVVFQIGKEWDEQAEAFNCVSGTSVFDRTASFEEAETANGVEFSNIRVTLHKLVGGNARTTPVDPTAFRRRRRK